MKYSQKYTDLIQKLKDIDQLHNRYYKIKELCNKCNKEENHQMLVETQIFKDI